MKLGKDLWVKIAIQSIGSVWIFVACLFSLPNLVQAGSFAVNIDQRFMSDKRFGDSIGFSDFFHPEFQIVGGFYNLAYGFEPVLSLAYLADSANTCAVLEDGVTCDPEPGLSLDRISYQIFSIGSGMKWSAWSREYFFISPYFQPQISYRWIRTERKSANTDEKNKISGGDFGFDLLAGAYISFLHDQMERKEMKEAWSIDDFGMSVHVRGILGGLFRHGLENIKTTGGWSFGLGLVAKW